MQCTVLLHVCSCIEWHNLYISFTTDAGFGQLRSESQNVASRQHSLNSAYELLVKQAEVCTLDEKAYHMYCYIMRYKFSDHCTAESVTYQSYAFQ